MTGYKNHYEVVVLGAGNAGLAAAGAAKAAGRSVLIVESREVGGTCPLRGCVPKKVLVAAAEALDQISRAQAHHIKVGTPELDWPALIARERSFVTGVPEEFEASLAGRGIEVIKGKARFVGPCEVKVGAKTFQADDFVVATGSKPRPLPIRGFERALTSDDLLQLTDLPASMVFIGAGVIAFEFAHVFARAGVEVTLLEAAPRPLGGLDQDAVSQLVLATELLGIKVITGVRVERIDAASSKSVSAQAPRQEVHFDHEGRLETLTTGAVVNGAGRVAHLAELNLEAASIRLDRGQVDLDAHLRSRDNPAIWFAGDNLAGAPQLSPVATYEGRIVGANLLAAEGERLTSPDYSTIPSVVHTVPPLASVGLTESAAVSAALEFEVRANDMRSWRSARTFAEPHAWAKVLVEKQTGKILGAHLLGHGASETIHTFALAMQQGLTSSDLANNVYAYPTFHSDLKYLV